MGKIRTVKPDLFRHRRLFDLEKKTKLPIRISWVGLFTLCDREGRFKWRPEEMKLDILPYDAVNFESVLDALEGAGMIQKYESDGAFYGCIPSFLSHQVVNHREQASKIPPPNNYNILATRDSRVGHASPGTPGQAPGEVEGKGREGKARVPRVAGMFVFEIWNQQCAKTPGLRPAKNFTQGRAAAVARLATDLPAESDWVSYFDRVGQSKFLTGKAPPKPGQRIFRADLDFVLRQEILAKTLEGFYDDDKGSAPTRGRILSDEDLKSFGGVL